MRRLQDQFTIEPMPQNAGVARERVKATAQNLGYHGAALDDIEVAVGEAVTNAILYGSPSASSPVSVSCYFDDVACMLSIEICDQGHGFDPSPMREVNDTDALGGRGLRLMRILMDKLLLYYDGNGMIVHLSKKLPAEK